MKEYFFISFFWSLLTRSRLAVDTLDINQIDIHILVAPNKPIHLLICYSTKLVLSSMSKHNVARRGKGHGHGFFYFFGSYYWSELLLENFIFYPTAKKE